MNLILATVLTVVPCQSSPPAQPDGDVKARVDALVTQLDDPSRREREEAQKALQELGPGVLRLLPDPDDEALTTEQRSRLRRLLPRLERAALAESVAGAKVTLPEGAVKLSALLEQVEQATGNAFKDMREDFNQEATDPELTFAGQTVTFWEAADLIAEQAGVSYYLTTDDRTLGLMGRPMPGKPTDHAGAFRFTAETMNMQSDFNPDTPAQAFLNLKLAVEPRLRPVLVEWDRSRFGGTTDTGEPVEFLGPPTISAPINPDMMVHDLTVQLAAPPRGAETIAKLTLEMDVWLPTAVAELVFKDLAAGKPIVKERPGLRARLEPVGEDDGIFTFPMVIEHLTEDRPTESYLQAAIENELFMVHADGARVPQNAGLATLFQEPGRSGFEYYFDAPGTLADYTLLVRIPSGLTKVPVRCEFADLPLP